MNIHDLQYITEELATKMCNGEFLMPSLRSVETLHRELLEAIAVDIEEGSTFSEALGRFPQHFDPFYIAMIRAGEAGGVLDIALERVAKYLKTQAALNKINEFRRIAIWAETFGTLLASGVPILQAIKLVGSCIQELKFIDLDCTSKLVILTRVMEFVIRDGGLPSRAFEGVPDALPEKFMRIIEEEESEGGFPDALIKIAEQARAEIQEAILSIAKKDSTQQ